MLITRVIQKKNSIIPSKSNCIVLSNNGQITVIAVGRNNVSQKNKKRRKSSRTGQGLYERSQNEMRTRRNKRRKRKVSVARAISGNTYVSIRQEKILAVGDARGRQVELIQ